MRIQRFHSLSKKKNDSMPLPIAPALLESEFDINFLQDHLCPASINFERNHSMFRIWEIVNYEMNLLGLSLGTLSTNSFTLLSALWVVFGESLYNYTAANGGDGPPAEDALHLLRESISLLNYDIRVNMAEILGHEE